MELLDLIIDFHKDMERQGPGSAQETERALSYIPNLNRESKIIDIGCGAGAQTMVLAEKTAAQILAVDLLPGFLAKLNEKIRRQNLDNRVRTETVSMLDLPYPDHEFDLIWAEGSIYHMGFAKGLREWQRILRPGGYMAVSEISWLTASRPPELEEYWRKAYAEIDTIANKIGVIEACGCIPVAHFILPESCWVENYYQPILARSEAFLEKHAGNEEVKEFIEDGKKEAAVYERYKDYYSYVFYILKKK